VAREVRRIQDSSSDAWVASLIGWAVPGAGHIWLGCVGRGLLLGGIVWSLFVMGLLFGGHLFDLFDVSNSNAGILSQLFGLFNIGIGLVYIICWLAGIGMIGFAERATFEYGNTFLIVAGLLNYLTILDAFDIGAGRKK
jgi:TM2 domain-containing membrane protein YozV